MNHSKSIQEMLSTPAGSRNVATSGYFSFTDTQFLFGSQFWPESSQSTSQELSMSSRTSQQSSQEGSDSNFMISYHTKPLLFGESKDKHKAFGILDKFEEDKKEAKEKSDSDILAKECLQIRETLNNIQQLVTDTGKSTPVCQTVLENIDKFSSLLQNNLNSLQSDISQQFESLLVKVNYLQEMMTELEEKVQKNGELRTEFDSNMESFKNHLECLKTEQESEQGMLVEVLRLLNTLVLEHSAKPNLEKIKDKSSQTSPGPDSRLETRQFEGTLNHLDQNEVSLRLNNSSRVIGKRKSTSRVLRGRKKRPLVLSQRNNHNVSNENSQPLMNHSQQQIVSTPLLECHDVVKVTRDDSLKQDSLTPLKKETKASEAAGCFITPLSCWSQDSSSSPCRTGIDPISKNLSSESKTGTPVKPEGFWQLFGIDSDSDTSI